jgi:hypothetical protein
MKKEFLIFKEGKTAEKVTILSKIGESFNRTEKIKMYLSLGYDVFELDGTKILN